MSESENLESAILHEIAQLVLRHIGRDMTLGNLATGDFKPEPAAVRDTVDIPVARILVSNPPYKTGTMNEVLQFTRSKDPEVCQIKLAYHMESSFEVPDIAALTDPIRLAHWTLTAALAQVEAIESALWALCNQFLPIEMDLADVERAVDAVETALFWARVPCSVPKCLVVGSRAFQAIRAHPGFTPLTDPYSPATRGRIKGLYVLLSNCNPPSRAVALGCDALGIVFRIPQKSAYPGWRAIQAHNGSGTLGLQVSLAPPKRDTLARQFAIELLYGVGILRNRFGVQISVKDGALKNV